MILYSKGKSGRSDCKILRDYFEKYSSMAYYEYTIKIFFINESKNIFQIMKLK